MGGIYLAGHYPAWMLRFLFLTFVALTIGALLLLLAVPPGVVQGGAVLAVHYLANALLLVTIWSLYRHEVGESWWAYLLTKVLAIAFGLGNAVLVVGAAANPGPHTVWLLTLIVPAAACLVAWSLDHARKNTPEETAEEDEATLARDGDEEVLSKFEKAKVYGCLYGWFAGAAVALFGVAWLGVGWFKIVWRAVDQGAAVDVQALAGTIWPSIRAGLPDLVRIVLVLLGILTITAVANAVRDRIKRFRNRRKIVNPAVETRVDALVHLVWNCANQAGRQTKFIPLYVIPAVLFAGWLLVILFSAHWQSWLAEWLFQRRHGGGWYIFHGNGIGTLFVLAGTGALFTAVWFLLVALSPVMESAAATARYRRNARNLSSNIEVLRKDLRRLVEKGADAAFDPRGYLLKQHRRFARWAYIAAAIVVPVALGCEWLALNSYTAITAAGAEDVGFTGRHTFWRWKDVKRVTIRCTLNRKDERRFDWDASFAGGRTISVFDTGDIAPNLPTLLAVDAILRGQGVVFETSDLDTGETRVTEACLQSIGANWPNRQGFLRLMHRD